MVLPSFIITLPSVITLVPSDIVMVSFISMVLPSFIIIILPSFIIAPSCIIAPSFMSPASKLAAEKAARTVQTMAVFNVFMFISFYVFC